MKRELPCRQTNHNWKFRRRYPSKTLVRVALLLLFFCRAAQANWTLLSTQGEPSVARGLEHRYLVLEDSASGERVSIELALFAVKLFKLRVIDQRDEPRFDLDRVMRREKCLAGVNGGYFAPDYKPIGLLIADGQMVAPMQRARLLTGVLAGAAGQFRILRVAEFAMNQKFDAAVECGPMLVDSRKPVSGLEATRDARRTFAATLTGGRAAVGFCSDVTLADLAKILTTLPSDLKINRALNLDGGSSSAFWFARKNGAVFSISEEKTVRDFVAIVPK